MKFTPLSFFGMSVLALSSFTEADTVTATRELKGHDSNLRVGQTPHSHQKNHANAAAHANAHANAHAASANIAPSKSSKPKCAADETLVEIYILTDPHAEETSIYLTDYNFDVVLFSAPLGTLADNTIYNQFYCVKNAGCYYIDVYDTFGDGFFSTSARSDQGVDVYVNDASTPTFTVGVGTSFAYTGKKLFGQCG